MPWIKIIPEHAAEGELKEVYRKIKAQRQGEAINRDRDTGSGGPPVAQREMIATVTSATLHCRF